MSRILLACLTTAALVHAAFAQEPERFLINTDPPGALILHRNEEWGISGKEFVVDGQKLPTRGDLHLELRRKNYRPADLKIPNAAWKYTSGIVSYPDSPIPLQPLHSFVSLQENPLPLVLAGLAFAGIGWMIRRNRQLTQTVAGREQRFEKLKEKLQEQHEFALNKIGRYLILDPLGEGGIAKVYRAVPDDSLDEAETVAIKILHPHLLKEGDHRERFVREGQVSKDLIHPHIVRLFEIDSDGEIVYLVLELLNGQTLRDKIREGTVTLDVAYGILRQIFSGLAFAHNSGVVHRDLTPANVMICHNGVVKLMDFGLARRQEVGHTITVTGMIQGTPGYMAPEQLTENVDARSDQYSLGVIMFEMFTGRRPIERADAMQLIMATYTEDAPDVRTINPHVPPAVAEVIARLLQRKADDRFATVEDASRAFDAALETLA